MKNEFALTDVSAYDSSRMNDRGMHLGAVIFFAAILAFNIVDVITAVQLMRAEEFTAGQVFKGLLFLFLFISNFRYIKIYRNMMFIYLLFFYMLLVESFNFFLFQYEIGFFVRGMSFVSKTIMPFLIYYFLVELRRKEYITLETLKRGFYLYIFLFSMIIIIPVLLGIAKTAYYKSGYTGLYNAGNELGSFLTVTSPILLYFFFTKTKNRKILFLLLVLLFTGGILTGAKTPLISIVVSAVAVPMLLSKRKYILFFLLLILVLFIYWIFISNLQSILSLLPKSIYGRLIWRISESHSLLEVLLGVRLDYFHAYLNDISNRNPISMLIGYGFIYSADFMFQRTGAYKVAEMDGIDLLSRYGLFGLLFVTAIIMIVLKNNYNKDSRYSVILTYMVVLLISNSLLAGHVFGNAFSALILGIIFSMNRITLPLNMRKNSLDSIGD